MTLLLVELEPRSTATKKKNMHCQSLRNGLKMQKKTGRIDLGRGTREGRTRSRLSAKLACVEIPREKSLED